MSTKNKRREGKEYVFAKKFINAREAEDFVQAESSWSVKLTHKTKEGIIKKYYRCNQVKYRGPQCAASICLLFEADSDSVTLYRAVSDHDHDFIGTRAAHGISEKAKEEIDKLIDLHLKPKAIINSLRDMRGIRVPSIKQLNNYLSDRRRRSSILQ